MSWIRPAVALMVLPMFSMGADYEKSSWRAQLYLQGYLAPLQIDLDHEVPSLDDLSSAGAAGLLWNPFQNPLFKWDLPFTPWVGFEVGQIQAANVYSSDTSSESLDFLMMMPSVVAGISWNIGGDFDIRALGGIGWAYTSFDYKYLLETGQKTATTMGYFGELALEYRLGSLTEGTDLKVAVTWRQDLHSITGLSAVREADTGALTVPGRLAGTRASIVSLANPGKIGLEFSLDFGREPRKDRAKRHRLYSRDDQLREKNRAYDTLKAWDCMAIERDYKFYVGPDGKLPDMRYKFTRAQYTDVLESFLAFCKTEDLRTKDALYTYMDSAKVQLHRYQNEQEESRYRQVMAANDTSLLVMFLKYYPNSKYAASVQSKIRVLADYQSFRGARSTNTFQSYLGYLKERPEGHYRKEAEEGIFTLVQQGNRIRDYEIYLKKFPDGLFVHEARKAIHILTKQQSQQQSVQ